MAERTNPDTTLGTDFWREHPHLFVPAGWGRKYCRCCLDPKRRKIHEVETDSSTHVGNCTGYRVARKSEVGFAPVGWSDNGAACSYQMFDTYEDALTFIDRIRDQFEHWQIDERHYFTAVNTNVVVLS